MKLVAHNIMWLALPWLATSSPLQTPVGTLGTLDGITHANHIFNAVHNSMRQFGSALQHNGMSVFIATVPKGVNFYHGSTSPYPVNGTDWLAFEPEHALAFAHPRREHHDHGAPEDEEGMHRAHVDGPGPQHDYAEHAGHMRSGNEGLGDPDHVQRPSPKEAIFSGSWMSALSGMFQSGQYFLHTYSRSGSTPTQASRTDLRRTTHHTPKTPRSHEVHWSPQTEPSNEESGFLHTYETTRQLRLFYFDGQSAAKSIKGTLDMQDIVLRNASASSFNGSPMEGDNIRAEELCAMARNKWDGLIDGFIRMVGGFEIILCSFSDSLETLSILGTHPARKDNGDAALSYSRAIQTRFDGIGGDRVSIDYEDFVSMFAFPDAIYFDQEGLPRVKNDTGSLEQVRVEIDRLATQRTPRKQKTNWQAVVDMIVSRYAPRIELMLSPAIQSHHELRRQLHLALEPFMDSTSRDYKSEIRRCASQFWPQNVDSSTIAARAVREVSTNLCAGLVSALAADTYEEGSTAIKGVKNYMDWTRFRRCNGCLVHEVCQLPIWPAGNKDDLLHPTCGSGRIHGAGDYWDMMGRFRAH